MLVKFCVAPTMIQPTQIISRLVKQKRFTNSNAVWQEEKNVELKWKGQNEIFPNPCLVTVQPKDLLTKPELCKGFMLRD